MQRTFCHRLLISATVLLVMISTPSMAQHEAKVPHLIPMPYQCDVTKGVLPINNGFCIALTGRDSSRLHEAAARFMTRLQRHTGIPFLKAPVPHAEDAILEIACMGEGEDIPSLDMDESYTLEVSDTHALLSALSPVGIVRGLETFIQLLDIDNHSFFVPCLKILDRPRFKWRGLHIDVSRHFQSVDMIKRNLDAMAAVKMNVLHWHLSDDQGFRIDSGSFPKLHQMGSDGYYYSRSEVREVIAYATKLGIRVVPEFDMPGHTTSWLVAYPELAAAPGPYAIERQWGVFEPCMDPSKEEVYAFLDIFIGEMAALFPDEYFHIGGDEVKANHWNSSTGIQDFKVRNNLSNNRDVQTYFNRRLLEILAKNGKKMIGWDEIFHPQLPESIVIQSWRGQASLAEGARQGYNGILSFGYYLDHMRPASFHYSVDPLGSEASALSGEEKSRILGGEACMWGEFVNSENIESRIWPRAAAIAERLWSPASINDIPDLYRRLEFINRELHLLGLRHGPLYYESLQRIAGNADIQPLRNFADLLRPPSLAIRKQSRRYFSHTPLNRLVDVLMPESGVAREFSERVDALLEHPDDSHDHRKSIRKSLTSWMQNSGPLQPIIQQSYILKETAPLSETIAELCEYSLEAITHMESNRRPPREWLDEAFALIDRAGKPQAEIYIAILPPIKKLIDAVAALP